MSAKVNIKGKSYGRLTAKEPTKKRRGSNIIWRCLCSCGNYTFVSTSDLKSGATKSCGCINREKLTKHGKTKTVEFRTWADMKQRCYNKNNSSYKNYGRRGIKVCKKWRKSFTQFLEDMGRRPSPELTIDRIDNDGNYCWYNCRWATYKEQANNKRRPIKRRAIKHG